MEPTFRTSFIPKKSLATDGVRKTKSGPFGLVTLLTFIILLAALTVGVGEFLYKQILASSIASKSQTLERARGAFEPALIQELVRIDARIAAAQTILNEHIAPSAFFDALEELTLKSVQFRDFKYTRISKDKISIVMKGRAKNYAGIALQADVFGKNRMIKEPIFSNLNLDQEGNVVFDFTAFIDPTLMKYTGAASNEFSDGSNQVTN